MLQRNANYTHVYNSRCLANSCVLAYVEVMGMTWIHEGLIAGEFILEDAENRVHARCVRINANTWKWIAYTTPMQGGSAGSLEMAIYLAQDAVEHGPLVFAGVS